jgi:hypothetical protein
MNRSLYEKAFVSLILVLFSTFSNATLLAPSGLNAGDKFHFIFVTSGTTDAFSADISTYNAFAQATADGAGIGSGMGLTNWRALASTPTINATDNLAPLFNDQYNVPIYNMGNNIVANSLMDLWSNGSTNTILYEENGLPNFGDVWTGTTPNGTADLYTALGSSTQLSRFGFPYNASQNISAAPLAYTNQFIQKHLYGVSQELIVLGNGEAALSSVPVPAAIWLFGTGLVGLIGIGKRKKCK